MSSARPIHAFPVLLLAVAHLLFPHSAAGADQEGCMLCHRLELRLPTDNGVKSLRTHDSPGGPHDSLYCSDCHPDARTVPHPASPGSAQCVGECHGGTAAAQAAHRNAGFGGLTEGHRSLTLQGSPCRLCHQARDRKGGRAVLRDRCTSCHLAEAAEVARGPHGRVKGGSCADCHPPHPTADAGVAAVKVSCAGTGCHRASTQRMESLVRHRNPQGGSSAGKVLVRAALFSVIAASGWILGAGLAPRPRRKGRKP